MYQDSVPRRPLVWRAFATNAAAVTSAAMLLAVSPATVSFPIAVAEALVLAGGVAVLLALNLALLPRAVRSEPCPREAPRETGARRDRVGPVLIYWTRPQRVTLREAERWLRAELAGILAAEQVGVAHLSRVRGACARHGAPYAWMLELDVPPGHDAQTWLESPAWSEWLGDLHALGLHPIALVSEDGRDLTLEAD